MIRVTGQPSGGTWRAFARACLLGSLAACVTTYEDVPIDAAARAAMPVAVAQTIPFPSGGGAADQRVLLEFYGSVLERMQSAAADRDFAQLEALLDAYERKDLPEWLCSVLAGYRALAMGLRFQRHAITAATLAVAPPEADGAATSAPLGPPLGAPLRFLLRLPATTARVRLGGGDDPDPTGFVVALTIEDTFADGSASSSKTQDSVWLPATFELAGDAVLEVPVGVDMPGAAAVKRVVHVRIDLMPGYAQIDGVRVPLQRTTVGACVLTQWPAGSEAIQKAPLAALRTALQIGDAVHFPHVFLAAQFATGDEREQALPLLVDQVRFGRDDQAQVAMAALRVLTGMNLSCGDRQAWLAWWQSRR